MAFRATAQEVAHLLPDLDITVTDIEIFQDQAKLIVDEEMSASGYSVARLKQLEMMLAAHFAIIAVERGGLRSTETMNAKEQYFWPTKSGEGFLGTRWGRQAVALDTAGILTALSTAKMTAQFRTV